MIKVFALLSVLFVTDCVPPKGSSEEREQNNKAASYLTYSQDPRTKLCFASYMTHAYSYTNVPCTYDVMKLIEGSQ